MRHRIGPHAVEQVHLANAPQAVAFGQLGGGEDGAPRAIPSAVARHEDRRPITGFDHAVQDGAGMAEVLVVPEFEVFRSEVRHHCMT